MPHIVIEHSNDVEVTQTMQELHHLLCNFGEFNPSAIKSRAIAFSEFELPSGCENFVHITISILEGRSDEVRTKLADSAYAIMQQQFAEVSKISLDIREMSAITYRKN